LALDYCYVFIYTVMYQLDQELLMDRYIQSFTNLGNRKPDSCIYSI